MEVMLDAVVEVKGRTCVVAGRYRGRGVGGGVNSLLVV